MDSPDKSWLNLARRCMEQTSSPSWNVLIARCRDWARASYLKDGHVPVLADHFADWFCGWFYEKGKVRQIVQAIDRRYSSSESQPSEDAETYFRNYLRLVIRTGMIEFFREQQMAEVQQSAEELESFAGRSDQPSTTKNELRTALCQLAPDLRVPFWLRHCRALGDLDEEDLCWVGEQSAINAQEIQQRIEAEIDRHRDRKHPLSAAFIGALLGISPCPGGGYNTVDQRIRVARDRLRDFLQARELGEG
jgi:hypothetical protein